jgi:hypothetical protein
MAVGTVVAGTGVLVAVPPHDARIIEDITRSANTLSLFLAITFPPMVIVNVFTGTPSCQQFKKV